MKITNNGGGGYCVGSEEPGKLLMNLKPGDNDVEQADWDKCKDRPAIKAVLRSGRLVVGGNPGAAPSKDHLVQYENADRLGRDLSKTKTPHDHLIDTAAQEKIDFAKYPTMGLIEDEALKFIAGCDDKAMLELCFEACEMGKDKRVAVKEALLARAVELGGDTTSDDAGTGSADSDGGDNASSDSE